MAIMIPEELRDDAPQSEKIIFERLKSSWQARSWTVYHSVYARNPQNPVMPREIDFVICIPECNAIICLEAKGGRYRITEGGNRWENTGSGEVIRSPLEQARTAMFALKNELIRVGAAKRSPESYISYGYAVALPNGNFPEGATLPEQSLILDQRDIDDPVGLTKKLKAYASALERKRAQNQDEVLEERLEFYAAIDYLERVLTM